MGIYFAKDGGRRRPKVGIDGNPGGQIFVLISIDIMYMISMRRIQVYAALKFPP
jgi:hypothetical protein